MLKFSKYVPIKIGGFRDETLDFLSGCIGSVRAGCGFCRGGRYGDVAFASARTDCVGQG